MEFKVPQFVSTQLNKGTQRMDKLRGHKVKAEGTSIWQEPSRTVIAGDQKTKAVYNIFRGGYSVLPVGEDHEGFVTLEEQAAIERNLNRYSRGLKVSIEGNIGSGM